MPAWICGFCGEPAWKLCKGEFAHYMNHIAGMAWHALEAHQVDMGLLDQARGMGRRGCCLMGECGCGELQTEAAIAAVRGPGASLMLHAGVGRRPRGPRQPGEVSDD